MPKNAGSRLARFVLFFAALGCSDTGHGNGSPGAALGGAGNAGGAQNGAGRVGTASSTAPSTRTSLEGTGGTQTAAFTAGGTWSGGATSARTSSAGGTANATGGNATHATKPSTSGGTGSGGSSESASTAAGGTSQPLFTGGTATSIVAAGGKASGGQSSASGGVSIAGAATGGKASGGQTAAMGGSSTNSSAGAKPSGGQTAATGGRGTSTGTGGGGTSSAVGGSSPFVLAWQDEFDTFDASKWQLMTHSWDGNLAQFSTENTTIASGVLSIHLTDAANDTVKPYRGVEMRSVKTITYGKVSARIRFAKGSGVISALVTIYTPWPADNWNEIDIEHLGNSPMSSQVNCMVYTGPPVTPPVTQSVTPTQDPLMVSPGFDAEAAFHQYDIEWTPAAVRILMDGALVRTWTKEIARMTLAQNILFTLWASDSASWAGPLTSSSAPTTADIDWIRVYDWNG